MPGFELVTRGQDIPAQCVRCFRIDQLVDFDTDVEYYGRIYLCTVCFGELADWAGLVPQQQYQRDLEAARIGQQRAEEMLAAVASERPGHLRMNITGETLDALLGEFRDTLLANLTPTEETPDDLDRTGDRAEPPADPPAPVVPDEVVADPTPEPAGEPGNAGDAVHPADADKPVQPRKPGRRPRTSEAAAERVVRLAEGSGEAVSIFDLVPGARDRAADVEDLDAAGSEGPDSGQPTGVLE